MFVFTPRASAMTFDVASDPSACGERRCFVAAGKIDKRTPKQLQAFLKANGAAPGDGLVLDSPGGEVMSSLRMGKLIREAGLDTSVGVYEASTGVFKRGGECASACVYVFLGGVRRSVGEGARVGVHQVYGLDGAWMTAGDSMQVMSMVGLHVNKLCGNLDLLVPTLRTPPAGMHWLSPVELARFDVVTDTAAD